MQHPTSNCHFALCIFSEEQKPIKMMYIIAFEREDYISKLQTEYREKGWYVEPFIPTSDNLLKSLPWEYQGEFPEIGHRWCVDLA